MDFEISKMTLGDIVSIENDFNTNFDQFWSISILKEDIKSTTSTYFLAKSNSEVIGLAGIKIILDEADIMNIVTRIDKRNLGIASALLSNLIEFAKKSNCSTISLEVNESNFPAIHLYEKFGFERIGFRKKYYNNTDNVIIMKKYIR